MDRGGIVPLKLHKQRDRLRSPTSASGRTQPHWNRAVWTSATPYSSPLTGSTDAWGYSMRHQNARAKADLASLDAKAIRAVVHPLFRRRNDYSEAALDELPAELSRFGILTVKNLRLLMKKHRRVLLNDESIRMSRAETLWLKQEINFAGLDAFAGKSWFSFAGLVRQAMELEFGEDAVVHVPERSL